MIILNTFAWVALFVAHIVSTATSPCLVQDEDKNETAVDCSHLLLTSLPPLDFYDVTSLDFSFNTLSFLHGSSFSRLTQLGHLDLSHNVLQTLDKQSFQGLRELRKLDLSSNNLSDLPSGIFVDVPNLEVLKLDHNKLKTLGRDIFRDRTHLRHLDLGNNDLQVLNNDTFSHLPLLTWLGVGSNRLERLEAGAMTGLNSLISLDLSHNHLSLIATVFPPRVFASLGKLQVLHLEHNDDSQNGEYPDNVFNDLVSLTSLTIDTFSDMNFGQDFAALRNIHTLDFSGNCKIRHLANDSLEGFKNSSLTFLHFEGCGMNDIELCAFCELLSLKQLWIIDQHWMTPNKALESLYGLQFQNMTEILLSNVGDYLQFLHVIDSHSARFLRNICVSSLSMVHSGLQRLAGNALTVRNSPFLNCIEHADFSQNRFMGDTSAFVKLITSKGRLRTLSLQDQHTFSIGDAQCLVSQDFGCKEDLVIGFHHVTTIVVNTPPNLTYLNISSVFPHFNPLPVNITFPSATKLEALDLSYLGMANCYATWYGLQNLKTFNLNGNYCFNISETMFDFLDSLKQLGLSRIGISPDFFLSRGWRLFQNLDRLEALDLSRNNLQFADPEMLRAQTRLTKLDFSFNRFQTVPVNVDNHGDLKMLDLSHNFLTTLTSSEQSALDSLAGRHTFSLKLVGNPLECACYNLDMVQWLWHTSVSLDGEGREANYTCTTGSGEITSTERVMAQWMSHWRHCVGSQIFGIAMSAFLLQILSIVVVFVTARSWTQLCYAWKAVRRHRLPRRHNFRRDAYVVYSDVERDVILACVKLREVLEEIYSVRLLLPDREDLPGSVKAETIVQHIDHSWKVVLLVTRDFSQDEWACGFTVQQAQRSITDTMPDRVIVVFFEEPRVLPAMPSLRLLLRMVPERNILHVHRDTPPQHPVWKTLADLITREQS
ncbi:toll-like receptor 3 isoform X1 [Littorina saxatilis]|uniref:TIR domain-containing protein n=2 Tax=Littorina saxatilis TaxID=31220 RepID=A0AAN9G4R8_9CAEN